MSDKPHWLTEAELRGKCNAEQSHTDPDLIARIRDFEERDRRLAAMQQRPTVPDLDRVVRPFVQRDRHGAAPVAGPRPRVTIAGAPRKPLTRTHTLEERRDAAQRGDDELWTGIETTMPPYVRIGLEKGDLQQRRERRPLPTDTELDRELGPHDHD